MKNYLWMGVFSMVVTTGAFAFGTGEGRLENNMDRARAPREVTEQGVLSCEKSSTGSWKDCDVQLVDAQTGRQVSLRVPDEMRALLKNTPSAVQVRIDGLQYPGAALRSGYVAVGAWEQIHI